MAANMVDAAWAKATPCVRLVVASKKYFFRSTNNNEAKIFRSIYRTGRGQAAFPWRAHGARSRAGSQRQLSHGQKLDEKKIASPRRLSAQPKRNVPRPGVPRNNCWPCKKLMVYQAKPCRRGVVKEACLPITWQAGKRLSVGPSP